MKVSIIGGTGFVGSYLVDELINGGHGPRLLVRPGRDARVQEPGKSEVVPGEVEDENAIAECLSGAHAVIYNIGILRELPNQGITFEELQHRAVERVIAEARAQGIRRFLLMSANGVRSDGTPYQRTKYLAEKALQDSDLDWTIFRPSVIFGDPRGRMEFCSQLRADIIDSPMPAPLFYDGLLPLHAGEFKMSPVSVRDVAAAFVNALGESWSFGQTLPLCGPDELTWKQILTTIAAAVGKTKLMLPAPALAVKSAATLFDRQTWFPITRDQIVMLLEGNTCDASEAFRRLGIEPQRFDESALSYLRTNPTSQ